MGVRCHDVKLNVLGAHEKELEIRYESNSAGIKRKQVLLNADKKSSN